MTVLLVEDEPLLRQELEETFPWESAGCRIVASAGTLAQARWAVEEYQPDILVTDIQLPDGDGISLIEEVMPKAAIIITGHAQIVYAQKALRVGAADFILKPLDDNELRQALRRAVAKLSTWHSAPQVQMDGKPGRGGQAANSHQSPLVQAALSFLHRQYRRNIGLFEAAQDVGVSEGHLASLFKAETGMTFVQALTQFRMEQACIYLRDPRFHVSEVAQLCGFNDPAYFTRVFKRHYGRTPREFRDHPG
ncbi:response regulator transcription factor [Spirochaeta lutea]|uniref:AraC family transcriptional regulator n=1 Tax=Spirochaeta lutea TaxID=1480694 RepID=A0A098QUX2_9SPIO|nr:helix-turn-helix domain-containing protein [Spirochaeta lutea]KGE71529.1 hypothetical protein DC28_09505 [Spirochaeta lutea]